MPAKAGIQNYLKILGSRLRGNDAKGHFKSFYEIIKFYKKFSLAKGSQINFRYQCQLVIYHIL